MKNQLTRTVVLFAGIVMVAAGVSAAPTGKKFATPEKAVEAFVASVRAYDLGTLVAIFGAGSEDMLETGDPAVDEKRRSEFLSLYDAKHEIVEQGDSRILVIGSGNWPFPIPIAKSGKKWAFDTAAGHDEVMNRRIGANELSAIQTCLAIADAQRDYYSRDRDGDGILEFAQTFRSTVGLRNGLFWRVEPDEPPSPLGEFVVAAASDGYTVGSGSYHGYRYKLLFSQGPNAPGGAYDYRARNDQIGGFAVVAYPAFYGDSGIVTFILSHSGILYQRDLGEATEATALELESFDPGEGWTKVEGTDLQPIVDASADGAR